MSYNKKMFQRKFVEKIKTHFLPKNISSENRVGKEIVWENIVATVRYDLG